MTTLFFCKDRVLVDSAVYLDKERLDSLNKVRLIDKPFKLTWKPREGVELDENRYPAAFEDTIHGYCVTGSNVAADLFMKRLEKKEGDLDFLFQTYWIAMEGHLINHLNLFTVIMIGRKACYAFSMENDDVTLSVVRRDNPTGYGSGGGYAVKEYFRTQDPIRAMYSALWHDEQSGGTIDIWLLPDEETPSLARIGICNAKPLREVMLILNKPFGKGDDLLKPDLIAYEAMDAKLMEWAQIGEEIGYLRGKGVIKDTGKRRDTAKLLSKLQEKGFNLKPKRQLKKKVVKTTRKTKATVTKRKHP